MSDSAAPFLFSGWSDPPDPTAVYTGDNLLAQRPDVYKAVVACLGQGMGIREIKRRLGVHHRTIQAVAIREGQTIDTLRRELGARALGLAGLAMEALEDKVLSGSVKAGELAMAIGVLVDKGQLLSGGATGRVEKLDRVAIERELEAIVLETDEITTGLSGGNSALLAAGQGQNPVSVDQFEDLGQVPLVAQDDFKSDVSGSPSIEAQACATTLDTEREGFE